MELVRGQRSEREVFHSISLLMSALESAVPPLTEFTPFPRLPGELRSKIWQYTIKARVVDLSWSSELGRCESSDDPTILQVSMEARMIGLKVYQPSFGTTSAAPVYFNFVIDIACIRWETLGLAPGRLTRMAEDCRRVKTLVIHIEDLNSHMQHGLELTKFESLEELQVSGCRRSRPYNVGHLRLSKEEVVLRLRANIISPVSRGRLLPPKLRCLGLGVKCREHWWFSTWNELCTIKLLSWPFRYSSVSDQACRILEGEEMLFEWIKDQRLSGECRDFGGNLGALKQRA